MTQTLRRAAFLDRDGVLNQAIVRAGKPYPPSSPVELVILPGVAESLARLKSAGFALLVVTNQPDVARGTQRREIVETMHAEMMKQLPIDEIFACYDDGDDCFRRKPNPGMLLEAALKHRISLPLSFMVGDRYRDVEAGQHAGCRTLFIDYGYREKRPEPPADVTIPSLAEGVDWILAQCQRPV